MLQRDHINYKPILHIAIFHPLRCIVDVFNIHYILVEIVKVKMKAGDLLIFNSLEPHGIRPNTTKDKVRPAQYIPMMPAEEDNEALRQWRITSWKERKLRRARPFRGIQEDGSRKISCGRS